MVIAEISERVHIICHRAISWANTSPLITTHVKYKLPVKTTDKTTTTTAER